MTTPNPTPAPDMAVEASRQKFEAVYAPGGNPEALSRTEHGTYRNAIVQSRWMGWQDALRAALARPQDVADTVAWHIDTHGVKSVALNKADLGLLAERYAKPLGFIDVAASRAPVAVGVEPKINLEAFTDLAMLKEADTLRAIAGHLEVMLASAQQHSDGESITGYTIKTGALHRIIGLLVGAGFRVIVPLAPAAEAVSGWTTEETEAVTDWLDNVRPATTSPGAVGSVGAEPAYDGVHGHPEFGAAAVSQSAALCGVCGLSRHVAAHLPLVFGPNAGEPFDHAFTLQAQDAVPVGPRNPTEQEHAAMDRALIHSSKIVDSGRLAAGVQGDAARLLTPQEILQALAAELNAGVKHTPHEIVQRKFCEVNSIPLAAAQSTKGA